MFLCKMTRQANHIIYTSMHTDCHQLFAVAFYLSSIIHHYDNKISMMLFIIVNIYLSRCCKYIVYSYSVPNVHFAGLSNSSIISNFFRF